MQVLRSRLLRGMISMIAAFMFVLPMQSQAAEIEETPSAAAMVFDGLIVRPLTLVATVAGTAIWLVTLPFSLLGGNAGEAADVLVLSPAEATFVRCLGCYQSGRKIEFEDR